MNDDDCGYKHFDVFEQIRDGVAMRAIPGAMHALVLQAVEEAYPFFTFALNAFQ